MPNWTVYALCHPVTGEVRYIGMTSHLRERVDKHIRRPARMLREWIESVELPDVATVRSDLSFQEAEELESETIRQCDRIGIDLLNERMPMPRIIRGTYATRPLPHHPNPIRATPARSV